MADRRIGGSAMAGRISAVTLEQLEQLGQFERIQRIGKVESFGRCASVASVIRADAGCFPCGWMRAVSVGG